MTIAMTTTSSLASTSDNPPDSNAPSWLRRVPMFTGILAALTGFLTVRGANLSNDAIYRSNQGVLHQTQASDLWTEYQADSIKARVVETALLATTQPTAKDALTAQAKDLRERQPKIKSDPQAQEQMRDADLVGGQRRLAQKDLLDYAGVAAQLGIALASVAALTRRKPAFAVGLVAGLAAIAVTAYALVAGYLVHG